MGLTEDRNTHLSEALVTEDSIRDLKLFQSREGYRYSADAILLADFVSTSRVRHCVDLGTGVGVIGLLVAKRYPRARVTGVELQASLADLAEGNVVTNGMAGRVRIVQGDVREVTTYLGTRCADLVVCNPPFRRPEAGRICPSEERKIARQEIYLSLEELTSSASRILKHRGRFCMVHLSERLTDVLSLLRAHGMEPKRLRFVCTRRSAGPDRFLVEAVKGGRAGLRVEFPLFSDEGNPNPKALTMNRGER